MSLSPECLIFNTDFDFISPIAALHIQLQQIIEISKTRLEIEKSRFEYEKNVGNQILDILRDFARK